MPDTARDLDVEFRCLLHRLYAVLRDYHDIVAREGRPVSWPAPCPLGDLCAEARRRRGEE